MVNGTARGGKTALGYAACAIAGGLWGTGFFWGRLALNEMSVEHMVFYRFLFATVGMLPVLVFDRRRTPFTFAEVRVLLISAALGVPVQFLLQFHGLALTTVSHAALMVGAFPVMLAAAATLFAGERLDRFGWASLAASTGGAALIVLNTSRSASAYNEPTLAGDLLVVASLVTALAWVLISKRLMQRHSAPVVTGYTILSGFGMLSVWVLGPWLLSPFTHRPVAPPPLAHVSATAWTALALAGLFCTATTTLLWNWGIHHVPASRAGVFLNIEPAMGSWLGMQFLGEHLGGWSWAGGALILVSALAMTTGRHVPETEMILE